MLYTNELIHETSPYLLQHAHNPVNWYPWGKLAFSKALQENKPVFVSIGYSTCHWCHVMAHECFEDETVADTLNRDFISIKVDREQRPDIDGIYMRACMSMTGSGGWPMSIFMTADGKPFFAGTYFPKNNFMCLLDALAKAWQENKPSLLKNQEKFIASMTEVSQNQSPTNNVPIDDAVVMFRQAFDSKYGGFGDAPKFPSPHNLMFLLYTAPEIAEKTLEQMYRGGIFDHIGGGFSRYSTDRYWLVPHFEKMLYDNALLAMAYLLAYETTNSELYRHVAKKVFVYLDRELCCPDGGFYSAQDADSDGGEGNFYLFTPDELTELLGKDDSIRFCRHYDITRKGNFKGKSIPNLLYAACPDSKADALLPKIYESRVKRAAPNIDTKILTSWNALAVSAYAMAARILKEQKYLDTARKTIDFIERNLTKENIIFVGVTGGKRYGTGFLDDYAFYIFALIQMYQATLDEKYLTRASELTGSTWNLFWDENHGGFYFSGKENEVLITRPKETLDSAMPSGNSVMAYNLSRLALLTENEQMEERAEKQRRFMNGEASAYPMGYGFYLYSALPVKKVICAMKNPEDISALRIRSDWAFRITGSHEYPLLNGKTTYYICENNTCFPPVNEL